MNFRKFFTTGVFSWMLLSISISAQNYIPFPYSDAAWNELEYHLQPISHINYSYTLKGDTTIGTQVYQNIYFEDTNLVSDSRYYAGSIRQDTAAKKVYAINCQWIEDEEVVLYDFSKSPGDTVFVGLEGAGPAGDYYIVENIDSIFVGGQYRRTFHFTGSVNLYDAYWIEGIGSTRGLFSPVSPVPTGFVWWELTCFWHDGELIFLNPEFDDCFPNWTNTDTQPKKPHETQIYASPNPSATGEILLKMENTALFPNPELKVFDVLGNQMHSETVYPQQGASRLDTSQWPAGIYVATFFSNGQIEGKCKILVE
jgi:hypothetical protein